MKRLLWLIYKKIRKNMYSFLSGVFLVLIAIVVVSAVSKQQTVSEVITMVKSGDEEGIVINREKEKAEQEKKQKEIEGLYATESDDIILQNKIAMDTVTVLPLDLEADEEYLDKCLFLGDSREVGMVSFGLVKDSKVLAEVGIAHTAALSTTYTQKSGERYTVDTFLKTHYEPVIYICYGVNGMNFINEARYKEAFIQLVDRVVELADGRSVVLMSIWPVNDYGTYQGSVKTEWVNRYNLFLFDLAASKGLYYLDVASMLTGEDGMVKHEYDAGDGLHYNLKGYNVIIDYIIQHPVKGI